MAPAPTIDVEALLSPSEAARLLGISSERVLQMAKSGQLPSFRTGLGHLIRPEDVAVEAEARRTKQPGKRK